MLADNYPIIRHIVDQEHEFKVERWQEDDQYTPTEASRLVSLDTLADGYIPAIEREHIAFRFPDKAHPPVYQLLPNGGETEIRESTWAPKWRPFSIF